MRKFNKQWISFTVLGFTILFSLAVTGCSQKDYSSKGEKNKETVSSGYSSRVTENLSSFVPEEDTTEKIPGDSTVIDKSISSGYYLSLGVLDESVVLNKAGRNESEMMVAGKKVIFPQGGIRSISIKSWSRKEEPYNPPKSEIIEYVDALESSEIVEDVPGNVLKKMVKIETHILYLNSHNKFRTISVTNFGNGYHEISVEKDDAEHFAKKISIKPDEGKKYNQVFLRSMEAEKIIKKWIHWESQGKKGFKSIQSANLIVNGNMVQLTEDQTNKLKTYLKADKKTAGFPCGYENYFECIQDDGSKFHFSISADGESISTDRRVYTADYPDNLEIVELFKEIYKSANK